MDGGAIWLERLMVGAEKTESLMPRVSVIVPIYNNDRTLVRALESLAAQDYQNFHVVAVDDCSSDNSVAIAQHYAAKHPFIRSATNERNLGAVGNYAAGKRYVEGEFFMIGGPDDSWAPNFISRMVELLRERPRAAAAISSIESRYDDGEVEIYRYPEFNTVYRDRPLRLALAIVNGIERSGKARSPYYSVIQGLVRSRYFDAVFLPDKTFWYVELQLVVMYALLGGLATTEEVLYTRHRFRQSWSERYPTDGLVHEAVRPAARLQSSFMFMRHAFCCKELTLTSKLAAIPVFLNILLFQILRPAIAPWLRAKLSARTLDTARSIFYKFF